jgi:hypothetical protein
MTSETKHASAGNHRARDDGGIVAALVRLALPARLAGLLGTRKRVTDVITLAALGAGLIVAGLVLPVTVG